MDSGLKKVLLILTAVFGAFVMMIAFFLTIAIFISVESPEAPNQTSNISNNISNSNLSLESPETRRNVSIYNELSENQYESYKNITKIKISENSTVYVNSVLEEGWVFEPYLDVVEASRPIIKQTFETDEKVDRVASIQYTSETNEYGNKELVYAGVVVMNRSTFDRINWKKFEAEDMREVTPVVIPNKASSDNQTNESLSDSGNDTTSFEEEINTLSEIAEEFSAIDDEPNDENPESSVRDYFYSITGFPVSYEHAYKFLNKDQIDKDFEEFETLMINLRTEAQYSGERYEFKNVSIDTKGEDEATVKIKYRVYVNGFTDGVTERKVNLTKKENGWKIDSIFNPYI